MVTTKVISSIFAAVTLTASLTVYVMRLRAREMKRKEAIQLVQELDQPSDDLAEELVGPSGNTLLKWVSQDLGVLPSGNVAAVEAVRDEQPLPTPAAKFNARGSIEYDSSRREVAQHYVLKERKRYMICLIQEAKNRFGTPSRSNANLLAVRKFLNDRMVSHKLRPTHVHQMLPLAVELVFVEGESEREAIEIGNLARERGLLAWCVKTWVSMFGTARQADLA